MKTQKYLITIEMPDGDMISPSWIQELIQADCDVEDKGRQKVLVEEIKQEVDLEQELYKHFGQVKDFTLGMRIGKYFYELGRKDEREQMMKEAVEGYVTLTLTGVLTVAATIKEGDNIGIDDKVRIIIIKEENK